MSLFQSLSPAAAAAEDHIVVVISIDGLAAFYQDDPNVVMPTLEKLKREGAVAERMTTTLPTSTWPNHATLLTGVGPAKHGVIGNHYWDRAREESVQLIADPIFNKDELVRVPTVYDLAYAAGFKTAAINWPTTRGASTLHWTTPDVGTDHLFQNFSTPELLKEFDEVGIPFRKHEEFCWSGEKVNRDLMNTRIALHVIKRHRPHLLFFHLLDVDGVQHKTGPRSEETYKSMRFVDDRLKEIIDLLQQEYPGRATVIVTTDHGFGVVRQRIHPNVKLRDAGLLKMAGLKVVERRAYAFPQGGSCFVYFGQGEDRAALAKQVAALFKGVEGIDRIILPRDYRKFSIPTPHEDERMPDMILTAKDGYGFANNTMGDVIVTPPSEKPTGAHGHDPTLPVLDGIFVAWGQGIKPGARLKRIDNRDVAPTVAALLGIEMKGVEGRVLKGIMNRWK